MSGRIRWAGHVASTERREKCTRFWWESPKERHNSEDRSTDKDGIRMDLRETGWGVEGIQLAQDRGGWLALVNRMMNLRILAPRS
jgi:hypothetical protein